MNKINLVGTCSDFLFDYEKFEEAFYRTYLTVKRTSGAVDVLPVIISERLLTRREKGMILKITGEYRSCNYEEDGKWHTWLYVFAQNAEELDEEEENNNEIYMEGFLCKLPKCRTTPLGKEITDLLIASNRRFGKSDYIPCIAWGRNAAYAGKLTIGTPVKVTGRVQSRLYNKRISDTQCEERVAYEVSISSIKGE